MIIGFDVIAKITMLKRIKKKEFGMEMFYLNYIFAPVKFQVCLRRTRGFGFSGFPIFRG
jgi:hypothetical protein